MIQQEKGIRTFSEHSYVQTWVYLLMLHMYSSYKFRP
jgi:hypothetical protein